MINEVSASAEAVLMWQGRNIDFLLTTKNMFYNSSLHNFKHSLDLCRCLLEMYGPVRIRALPCHKHDTRWMFINLNLKYTKVCLRIKYILKIHKNIFYKSLCDYISERSNNINWLKKVILSIYGLSGRVLL